MPYPSKSIFKCTWVWHTTAGPNTCEKCAGLNGYTWHHQDIDENLLIHSVLGPVWDFVQDISLVHPNCMCTVIGELEMPEFADLQARYEGIKGLMKEMGEFGIAK